MTVYAITDTKTGIAPTYLQTTRSWLSRVMFDSIVINTTDDDCEQQVEAVVLGLQ